LESFYKNGDNVSVSVFYKNFIDHIERVFGSGGITWNNVGKSTVRGIEFEGKKKLGKHFEFRANVTLVKSESEVIIQIFELVDGVKNYRPIDTLSRPMFGQAPYIVNGIFSYTSDSLGLTATLSYNVQGPRLVITGIQKGYPDVYEITRNLIDFKVSKTLGKHFNVSVTIRDILNQPVKRAYKYNLDGKVKDLPGGPKSFDSFRYGTNYLLSLAYKF
jgi:outer membrane receptor protein involved in Fe transport